MKYKLARAVNTDQRCACVARVTEATGARSLPTGDAGGALPVGISVVVVVDSRRKRGDALVLSATTSEPRAQS